MMKKAAMTLNRVAAMSNGTTTTSNRAATTGRVGTTNKADPVVMTNE